MLHGFLQEPAATSVRADVEALRDLQQDIICQGQAGGGSDDRIMQSAVSMCEGALGILKAAMAGARPGNQSVRSS